MGFVSFRPGNPGSTATGRGVLSLTGLSHGVVRVDKEGSLTALTLQDCGMVIPGGKFLRVWPCVVLLFLTSLYRGHIRSIAEIEAFFRII